MSTPASAAREYLIGLLPPGSRRWLALETTDNIGRIFTALGTAFKQYGFDVLDTLRSELDFLRGMSARLPDWEAVFGLGSTYTAKFGTDAQRRAQIVAKLREWGTPTPANITAALIAVTGSASSVSILEHSRATLTTAHTYSFGTTTATAGNTASITITIGDNAPASQAGAQFIINLSGWDPAAIMTITAPDAQVYTFDSAKVISDGSDYYYYWKAFAGGIVDGNWTLNIDNTAGAVDVQLDASSVFVEGEGRVGFTSVEGLDANIYSWSARIDESSVDATKYDRDVARGVVRNWNPAHCTGYLVIKNLNGGNSGIWGDPTNSIWDGFTWE